MRQSSQSIPIPAHLHTRPRVSIMMPCYNANATLPRALASVLAQTFEDWECVVVNDGSAVSPAPIIDAAQDDRIRLITLPRNAGRAVARQVALDNARGGFLAMLDADDWMFPSRLSDQLVILEGHPEIALVSSSMAIVDGGDEMVGVRPSTWHGEPRFATFRQLGAPPVVHAPSMIQMSIAKQFSYVPSYKRAQDFDFLLKVLLGRHFAVLGKIHYAYAETAEMSLSKLLESQLHVRDIFRSYSKGSPIRTCYLTGLSYVKSAIYVAAFSLNLDARLIARRSVSPSAKDVADFKQARATVEETRTRIFGDMEPSLAGATAGPRV